VWSRAIEAVLARQARAAPREEEGAAIVAANRDLVAVTRRVLRARPEWTALVGVEQVYYAKPLYWGLRNHQPVPLGRTLAAEARCLVWWTQLGLRLEVSLHQWVGMADAGRKCADLLAAILATRRRLLLIAGATRPRPSGGPAAAAPGSTGERCAPGQ
jgi:hypothetical protein